MRKALVIGLDFYERVSPLRGCVNDAHSVATALERNANGTVNFGVKLLTSTGPAALVNRVALKSALESLFGDDNEVALFYFAGHGHIEATGGYILASDNGRGDEGIPLGDIITYANKSRAKNKIVVLDSCFSGIIGAPTSDGRIAELSEGLTILTASTAEQYASENNGSGVFTNLFVDALNGAAANLLGSVTPGSVYAHIDQSLGPWDQRPVFKTNVKSFVSLREATPAVDLTELRMLLQLFPTPGFLFALDPAYEPERTANDVGVVPPDPEKTRIFRILQKFNRVNLVVPVDASHMYHAAMQFKSCRLTVLGEHYRRLIANGRI